VSLWVAAGVGAAALLAVYAALVGGLVLAGRSELARAVAGFIPDCVVLCRRLLADPRVPRGSKLLLAALIPYLALPFDVVPDFIPVAGYLDDAVIVALVLRRVLRGAGPAVVAEHWPGPPASLGVILGLAGRGFRGYVSSHATARISGSSTATARQNRPPSVET
jgi:uncharacterized membrane protein YkvA (DUF1232 family)